MQPGSVGDCPRAGLLSFCTNLEGLPGQGVVAGPCASMLTPLAPAQTEGGVWPLLVQLLFLLETKTQRDYFATMRIHEEEPEFHGADGFKL